MDNITKKAVELNNYSSSSSKSSGVSAGVTINYNNGFQAEADVIRVSASNLKWIPMEQISKMVYL